MTMTPPPFWIDPDVVAYETRRDREERGPHRLDSWLVQRYIQAIMRAGPMEVVADLERRIWQRYGRRESWNLNRQALAQLKESILMRRAQLEREHQQ